MYCFKLFTAGQTIKTAVELSAVVFLLCTAGCCTSSCPDKGTKSDKMSVSEKVRTRPVRKRSNEYSRIPGNYPAGWQTSTIGN